MLDKSKSSVQDTKSTRNQTKRVHHRIEQACSRIETVYVFRLFTHIELKVSSGSVLTTRASPVFKSSTSN